MRRFALLAAATASLALAGCVSSATVYAPQTGPNSSGFSEYRLEPDRWRVTYVGGAGGALMVVEDYGLLRAAELTIGQDYDWFEVVGGYGGSTGRGSGSSLSIGGSSFDYGRGGGFGLGLGTTLPLGGGPQLARTLEIVMGKGAAPQRADVYDARTIQQSLRGRYGGYAPPVSPSPAPASSGGYYDRTT